MSADDPRWAIRCVEQSCVWRGGFCPWHGHSSEHEETRLEQVGRSLAANRGLARGSARQLTIDELLAANGDAA
jgi:hypothetical protein